LEQASTGAAHLEMAHSSQCPAPHSSAQNCFAHWTTGNKEPVASPHPEAMHFCVAAITERVGYENVSTFGRLFNRQVGHSSGRYRETSIRPDGR
jgi:AraC-like DNA-binding protein